MLESPAPALKLGHSGSSGVIAVVIMKIVQANGSHVAFCSLAEVVYDCLTSFPGWVGAGRRLWWGPAGGLWDAGPS